MLGCSQSPSDVTTAHFRKRRLVKNVVEFQRLDQELRVRYKPTVFRQWVVDNYEYVNDGKCVYICLDARDYPCSKEHSGLEKKKADIEVLEMVCEEYGVCYN